MKKLTLIASLLVLWMTATASANPIHPELICRNKDLKLPVAALFYTEQKGWLASLNDGYDSLFPRNDQRIPWLSCHSHNDTLVCPGRWVLGQPGTLVFFRNQGITFARFERSPIFGSTEVIATCGLR